MVFCLGWSLRFLCSSDQFSHQLSSLRPQWYILYASVNRPSLDQIMVRRLFCVKPLCHPVLTSPINQREHISMNFYLKMQQLYIFFPSCCCDLAVVTGLTSASHLSRPLREGDPVPVSPRLQNDRLANWYKSVRLMSDQYWSGGLGDIWFLYLFGRGNFFLHVIILTITRRETFGCLRSINPNMINHIAKQSLLLF